ncbi:hypothetical protein ACIQYF_20145 [Pseudomonas sp. NPDC096917]|uniref:hypothetical protein n=1 Tax=Pseudomonas sp. NPDC096917 TaxID=3364483 RepID=UPI00383B8C6F
MKQTQCVFLKSEYSFELASDYLIKYVDEYRPTVIPPTAPSNLKTAYDPIIQQLTVTFTKGEAHVGGATHTLIVKTDIESTYEPVYSDHVIPMARSVDYTLTLYATDQDNNVSPSITLEDTTKENGRYDPEEIHEQTVLREELDKGSIRWKGADNIAQYKIHLYDTKDIEGGEGGVDGKIIGGPLRHVLYSGSELTYTHANPAWDQEYPTVPSHLMACYRYREGKLYVYWNASTDNIGISHYAVTINNQLFKITESPISGALELIIPLAKDITYQVLAYAVEVNGNRSRSAWFDGTTSNKDTQNVTPHTPQIARIYRDINDNVMFMWNYIHFAESLPLIIKELDGSNTQLIRLTGTYQGVAVSNLQHDTNYLIEMYGTNSYGENRQHKNDSFSV